MSTVKCTNCLFIISTFHGVATVDSKRIPWLGLMQKLNLILLFLTGIPSFIHFLIMGILEGKFIILKIIRVLTNLIVFKVAIDCYKDRPHLSLMKFLKYLTPKEEARLAKYFKIRTGLVLLLTPVVIFYFYICGWDELKVLLSTQPHPQTWEAILHMVNFEMAYGCLIFANMYYNFIQFVCFIYAQKCKEQFESFEGDNFELFVKIKCQEFNRIRQVVNETLGFLPLALLTIFWISFVFGFAYVCTHREFFSTKFTMVTLGTSALLMFLTLCEALYFIEKGEATMAQARRIAASKVTNRMASFKCQMGQINNYTG